MNNSDNASASFIRIFLGLLASIGVGVIVSQQVDIIGNPLSIIVGVLTIITGLISTKILTAVAPRREKPSRYGGLAMIVFLAAYAVLGKMLWNSASALAFLAYVAAGGIYIWLVFTSIAETALIYAIGLGGFLSGLIGVTLIAIYPAPVQELMSNVVVPTEKNIIYTSIGLICAFSGAFASIAGRLSGWGLVENRTTQTWTFNEEGRLQIRKD